MILFYTNQSNSIDGSLIDEEFHHCTHVLRKKIGDVINITNGNGELLKGKIKTIKKSNLQFEVLEVKQHERPKHAHCIAISPTKSMERAEWFLEKAIEIGIQEITFVKFNRTERSHINQTRLQKIALSAMKQSLQFYLPSIAIMESAEIMIEAYQHYDQKLLANCLTPSDQSIANQFNMSKNSIMVIGPEGDFTSQEIELFETNGYKSISLGHTRLRTETAGVVAAALLQNL